MIYAVRDADEGESGHSVDKRLLAVESEFASVLRVMEREGNTVSARIRDAWDTGTLSTLTKTPLTARDAHISIVGHITVDELRRYLTRTESGNGFANRILWVCVKRSKMLPDGGDLDESTLNMLVERLKVIVDFARSTGRVTRDEQARTLWHQVYPYLSRDVPGLLGSVTSRAEAQVTRLSLLYALLDRSNVIRIPHLHAALAVWRYCEDSARFIFGDATGDPLGDMVLAALKTAPEGLTLSDIHECLHRNTKSERLRSVLTTLLQNGMARVEKQESESGKGRPAEVWHYVDTSELALGTVNPESNAYEFNERNELNTSAPGLSSLNSFSSYPADEEGGEEVRI